MVRRRQRAEPARQHGYPLFRLLDERLCKVIAHNLCVLTASIYEHGIEADFWTQPPVAEAG